MLGNICHKLYYVGDYMNKSKSWEIVRFFLAFGIFKFLAIPLILFLHYVLGMNLSGENINDLLLVELTHSTIVVIIMFFLFKDKLKQGLDKFKKCGSEKFIKKVIISGLILFLVKIGAGVVIAILTSILGLPSTTVENQELIEKMLESAPLMMMISTVIFAPLTEELIFRSGVHDVIKNKKVYIAVSGLIFGLMHVTDSVIFLMEILLLGVVISRLVGSDKYHKNTKLALSFTVVSTLLLLFSGIYYLQFGNLVTKLASLDMVEVVGSLVYIAIGCYLAYLYTKDENILYTVGVHAFNNFVSMLLII